MVFKSGTRLPVQAPFAKTTVPLIAVIPVQGRKRCRGKPCCMSKELAYGDLLFFVGTKLRHDIRNHLIFRKVAVLE